MKWLPFLVDGAIITIQVTLLAGVVSTILAFLSGLGRLSNIAPIRYVSRTYMEIFRASSLLVLLFWVYFALPMIGLELPKLWAAVLAIGLNIGAYGSEIVRSAIVSIPQGQYEASTALNLTPLQRMVKIIMPQAIVRMLPPMGNLWIELLKSTSLVYFIAMYDLTFEAMIIRNNNQSYEAIIFGLLLVIYFLLSTCVTVTVRLLERKLTAWR
ncbi:ectoine/hydroxyectoine ABC transporter permease subunit EhuC [Paenibacillus chungangensis]|uniref:Ectoine/hydroxyectoine ABC transporter permease subunit EhuC n=1 Tax=Paenibacillus chungangensis TaxID=696535 RepID=A0ABW3HNF2_9BACL